MSSKPPILFLHALSANGESGIPLYSFALEDGEWVCEDLTMRTGPTTRHESLDKAFTYAWHQVSMEAQKNEPIVEHCCRGNIAAMTGCLNHRTGECYCICQGCKPR